MNALGHDAVLGCARAKREREQERGQRKSTGNTRARARRHHESKGTGNTRARAHGQHESKSTRATREQGHRQQLTRNTTRRAHERGASAPGPVPREPTAHELSGVLGPAI